MEVHFSADKEAQMLEYDSRFIEAVEVGRASARRGDLLEHDEVVEHIEQMFRS